MSVIEWLTTQEAADQIGVTRRQIQAMIDSGRLRAEKKGRDWMVSRDDLEAARDQAVIRRRVTQEEKTEIIQRYQSGESAKDLAAHFSISPVTVFRIVKKK